MPFSGSDSYLTDKQLNLLEGIFVVKDYQRGYRWEKPQIVRLLNDLWQAKKKGGKHFLQPIVVRKIEPEPKLLTEGQTGSSGGDWWELIDGQQRLTTLYLLWAYAERLMMRREESEFRAGHRFALAYKTRPDSAAFLHTLGYGFDQNNDNIDFYYMRQALGCIEDWFSGFGGSSRDEAAAIYVAVGTLATMLWYDPGLNAGSSSEIFTRLNIGKIPLTNAELLRGWFLSEETTLGDNQSDLKARRIEIGLQWDTIEHELSDQDFWSFVTNKHRDDYDTKIDLLMEMAAARHGEWSAGKTAEEYATFYALSGLDKETSRPDALGLWQKIYRDYQILRFWYEDRELYHKIGYLITAKAVSVESLLAEAEKVGGQSFQVYLDELIKKTLPPNLEELSYTGHYRDCFNCLLLFNILSMLGRSTEGRETASTDRYPFAIHKRRKQPWSLEHIHAQHDRGLRQLEQMRRWVKDHREFIWDMDVPENIDEPEKVRERLARTRKLLEPYGEEKNLEKISEQTFAALVSAVESLLSSLEERSDAEQSLGNLALLRQGNNSALSNEEFEVKRRKIIEMDKDGEFIPLCTKRVFMRYYSDQKNRDLPYWGRGDREAYVRAIKETLRDDLEDETPEASHE